LVNNAGGATGSSRLETVSLEDFDHTFAVHVRGAMAHMKHVAATDIVVDGGAIGGRRFSEVMAGRQATRTLLD